MGYEAYLEVPQRAIAPCVDPASIAILNEFRYFAMEIDGGAEDLVDGNHHVFLRQRIDDIGSRSVEELVHARF